jgi:hypothetical protein
MANAELRSMNCGAAFGGDKRRSADETEMKQDIKRGGSLMLGAES